MNRGGCVVIAGTSAGIYWSTDAGATWSLGNGSPTSVVSVKFSTSDAQHAWTLGRSDSMRVYLTSDAGVTWTRSEPGFVTLKTVNLVPDPETPTAAYLGAQTGIFRLTDMGSKWSTVHSGWHIAKISTITAGPPGSDRAYLEMAENGVFKTLDRGMNWTRCNDFLSCGNICAIGVLFESGGDALYTLEGSG